MTDLVRYEPPQSSLELAPQAWKLAEKIAGTDFVPTALRGKPEAVLACILAGHEAGISPMQALSKIHIIEGRPAMSAELMRALVLRHGHELNYDEVTTTSVKASGRRKGSERWTTVTWTMDDAKRGGLDGKTNWRRWPRAMLIARATAELCRMLFPDVLAGISHTVEELSDGDVADGLVDFGPAEISAATVAPAPKATAKAAGGAITRKSAPAAEIDTKPPAPAGEIPALPGDEPEVADAEVIDDDPPAADEDPEIIDPPELPEVADAPPAAAEPVDDWAPGEWAPGEWEAGDFPTEPNPEASKRYTGPQLIAIKLAEKFGVKGNSAEARAFRLRAISHLVGREITSSKDLTPAEISTVCEVIDLWPAGQPLFDEDPAPTAPAPAPAPRAAVARHDPDDWTGDQWRDLLAARKVKVTETMREAQRLAGLRTPPAAIGTLDEIAGTGIGSDLAGWVEDLSLDRRSK